MNTCTCATNLEDFCALISSSLPFLLFHHTQVVLNASLVPLAVMVASLNLMMPYSHTGAFINLHVRVIEAVVLGGYLQHSGPCWFLFQGYHQ